MPFKLSWMPSTRGALAIGFASAMFAITAAHTVAAMPTPPRPGMQAGGGTEPAPDPLHLPGLTLNSSKLTLQEVTAQLNGALGVANAFAPGPGAGGNYSLHAQDKPLWDIFVELSQRQNIGLSFSQTNQPLQSGIPLQAGGDTIQRYAIDGPVLVILNSLTLRRTLALQAPPGTTTTQEAIELPLILAVDPRLSVSRFTIEASTITSAEDGSLVAKSGSFGGGLDGRRGNSQTFTFRFGLQGALPDKPLDIEMPISMTAGGFTTSAISDLEHAGNQPQMLGGVMMTIQNFRVNAGRIDMVIACQPAMRGGPMMNPNGLTVQLQDATGKVLADERVNGGMLMSHVTAPDAQGPFKLVCRAPTEGRAMRALLHFKNIPAP